MKRSESFAALAALALLLAISRATTHAETLSFLPLKDNTIYLDSTGQLSNGQGIYLFSGRTNSDLLRRALVSFDLRSIPTNAAVTDVTFSMFLNRPRPNDIPVDVSLAKALRDWGEGASNSGTPGGIGAQAQANDATWLHNFYDTSFWENPGGDFSPDLSATTPITTNGLYTWSDSVLLSDVQSWVSDPASNFGWFILGTEMVTGSAQRFNSRQNSANPPQLTVTYQVGSPTPTPTPTPPMAPPSLGNLSTRLRVGSDNYVLIAGTIPTGPGNKRVIFRALGPSLNQFDVPNALADPVIDLYQENTLLFSNDDWRNSKQEAEIAASGFAPSNDAESAIIWTLNPGHGYSVVVRGKEGATGVGLAEIFDLDPVAASYLADLSARGVIGTDENLMIGGFITLPGNLPTTRILARLLGPTLIAIGLPDTLADPTLDLVNANGTVIRTNNNWRDSQLDEIQATGLAPTYDAEPALVENLIPGSYTLVGRGNAQTTGLGLLELYDLSLPENSEIRMSESPDIREHNR